MPALFCIFQYLQEKVKPMKFEDEENEEVAAELNQYAHGAEGENVLQNFVDAYKQ